MLEPEQVHCYQNISSKFVDIAVINTCSSFLSLLACLLVIATILLFKKHIFFNQRLVFYLCLAGAANGTAGVARASAYFPTNGTYSYSAYCAWSGFSIQVTIWIFYLALLVVYVDMYLRIVKQKDTTRFEMLYILAIFLLPLVFTWIPFTYSAYGQAGPWCWIRAINFDQNCTVFLPGLLSRYVLNYLPLIAMCVIGFILYILMVRHIYVTRFTGIYDPQAATTRKTMLKEARPFLIYPWIFLGIQLVSLINRAVSGEYTYIVIVLWMLNGLLSPLQTGIAAVAFGLDTVTIRRLFKYKSYHGYLCCQQEIVKEYDFEVPDRTDSFRSVSLNSYASLHD